MDVRNASITALFSLLVLVLPGCGGDGPTGLSRADLTGDYTATTLTITVGGTTTDALARGMSLQITLHADGTTSGRFAIPAEMRQSEDAAQVSMEGTWELAESTVTFDQPADTFVRDMEFTATPGRLEGGETFGDETVRLVLERG